MSSNIGRRWYFGWNIVAAAALLTLLSTGMRLGVGPYFLPMANDLGFSRTLLAGIMAVAMLCYGLAMPVVGLLVSRYGTRNMLLAGAGGVLLSTLATVSAHSATGFLFAFGIAFSIALAFISPVALTPVVSHWFTRRRGMALFYLATGSMAGIAVMTPAMAWAIGAFGWRATLVGFSVVLAACTVPLALFVIRDRPPVNTDLLPEEEAAQRAHLATLPQPLEPAQAIRTSPFWIIVFGMFCCGFSMNLLGTHGVPMLLDRGFDPFTSSVTVGLIGIAGIAGAMILAGLADRHRRRRLLALVFLVRGIGFLALMLAGSGLELYATAAVLGIFWAGAAALSSALLADIYGVRLVGVLYGTAYFGHQIGAALSSFLGGWAYETFGSHWLAFGASGVLLLAAAGLALQLPHKAGRALLPRPAVAP